MVFVSVESYVSWLSFRVVIVSDANLKMVK